MAEQRLPLAAYLLARTLDRRPVDADGIAALRTADDAGGDVRAALPYGRGNVETDVKRTNGESYIRMLAARKMCDDWHADPVLLFEDGDMDARIAHAAASRLYGAGNCSEHASVEALAYGARARADQRPPDEQVHIVEHEIEEEDHRWVEVRRSDPAQPTVVVDAWADGSAVFAEDSRFAKDREQLVSTEAFDVEIAAEAHQRAVTLALEWGSQGDDAERGLREVRAEVMSSGGVEPGEPPQSVLDEAFVHRVRERVDTGDPWAVVCTEAQAAGVAMALGSRRVADRARDADRIVQAVKAL